MPKLKTSKAIAKRFRVTATGKILRRQPFRSHILEKKPAKRKLSLRNVKLVSFMEMESIFKKIPYSRK
uniref:ribosomal protein L35 n=1 Tax=Erythrolobus coxiae TaxID=362235 RepID=UPI001FCCCBD0|nr:ribosomal protein L35 [Erythrolobus coxiae]UNJ17767.1 ribosomal protein L35 [Erythrolobus coxiae]